MAAGRTRQPGYKRVVRASSVVCFILALRELEKSIHAHRVTRTLVVVRSQLLSMAIPVHGNLGRTGDLLEINCSAMRRTYTASEEGRQVRRTRLGFQCGMPRSYCEILWVQVTVRRSFHGGRVLRTRSASQPRSVGSARSVRLFSQAWNFRHPITRSRLHRRWRGGGLNSWLNL